MKLKCISLVKKNKWEIVNKEINFDLDKNKILVKILYSGICRSQLMEIDMKRGKDLYLPHMMGHEAIGIVKKIGDSISKVKEGDKVVLSWIKGDGISTGGGQIVFNNKKKVNFGPITTFTNYSVISEDRCFKVKKNFPNKIGAFFGCSILTGAGMVFNHTKILPKHNVLVIGIGGIGLASLLALKCINVKNVLVIENNSSRHKLIKNIGFKNITNFKDSQFNDKISKNKFDICIEAAGKVETIELGFSLIKDNGKLIFASHPDAEKKIKIHPHDLIKGKKIIGSWGGNSKPDKDITLFYKLLKKNNLLKYLKPKVYDFDNFDKAINDFRKGKVLRPILKL